MAKRRRHSSHSAPGAPPLAVTAPDGGASQAAQLVKQALSAFGRGDDGAAAGLAAGDARAAALLRPLLQAVRGELPPAAAAAPRPLDALLQAASAVAHAVRGEPQQARAALARIPHAHQRALLFAELSAAVDLTEAPRAAGAIRRLARSSLIRTSPALGETALSEAAAQAIDAADAAQRARFPGLTAAQRARVASASLRARLAAASAPAAQATLLRDVDPALFPPHARDSATLYQGFGLLDEDPDEAERCFDRVIASGGDLAEALRGAMLAALAAERDELPGSDERRAAARKAASHAEQLGKALSREPEARWLAAAAAGIAADAWLRAGSAPRAEASLAEARARGAPAEDLELLEIGALGLRDRDAARARADEILARDRSRPGAWLLRVRLEERPQEALALAREGAALTGHPSLREAVEDLEDELEDELEGELDDEACEPEALDARLVPAPLVRAFIATWLKSIGLPLSALDRLPPVRRDEVSREMFTLLQRSPDNRSAARMEELVAEIVVAAAASRRGGRRGGKRKR